MKKLNDHLVIEAPRIIVKGENVINLDFQSPIATSGAAVTRYVDKEDAGEYIYSLFVPSDASTAFPCFDQPDLKAKFDLRLNVPFKWKAVSNAKTKSSWADLTTETYIFEETLPISTYVFAFAAGEFAEFEDKESLIPSKLFVRKSQTGKLENVNAESADGSLATSAKAREKTLQSSPIEVEHTTTSLRSVGGRTVRAPVEEVFRLNRKAVEYLESYFDYKFPFPKYDLVLIPEFPFGGMEHAGATFLREDRVIFSSEPTANDYITRGNLIFHEAAHQWFGNLVTMRWFDDLWLKEGFAEFMAYKTMEKVLPEFNAWKAFYERHKPLAYLTDSTKGTTPIYQEIPNLSAAKSAYGNIVYRKAPSFLRQAEFYFGADKFQTAVRTFLKQNAFENAEWQDMVKSFEAASGQNLKNWANDWVKTRGAPVIKSRIEYFANAPERIRIEQYSSPFTGWQFKTQILWRDNNNKFQVSTVKFEEAGSVYPPEQSDSSYTFVFPNYQDYGYGIFLLDERSRKYILANIQNEKDDFLRAMMWGALWDSVCEAELDPKDYIELAIKNIGAETDELTIQTILGRVAIAMNYYLSEKQGAELAPKIESVLGDKIQRASTVGQRITFHRAYLNIASSKGTENLLTYLFWSYSKKPSAQLMTMLPLKTKDKFDIVTRLLILNDPNAPNLLTHLSKTETSDEAKRYTYAARAAIATAENKKNFFDEFLNNKEISESYFETALAPFNSIKHSELTLPFLERALTELPNLKRSRKIFFVNNWLAAFIGGQRDEKALAMVNQFLKDNPNLDKDLRLKILESSDGLERAIKIRKKFAGQQN